MLSNSEFRRCCDCVCCPGDIGVPRAVSDAVWDLRLVHEELHLLPGQQSHLEGIGMRCWRLEWNWSRLKCMKCKFNTHLPKIIHIYQPPPWPHHSSPPPSSSPFLLLPPSSSPLLLPPSSSPLPPPPHCRMQFGTTSLFTSALYVWSSTRVVVRCGLLMTRSTRKRGTWSCKPPRDLHICLSIASLQGSR